MSSNVGGSQSKRSRSQEVGQQRSREDTTSGRSKLEIAKSDWKLLVQQLEQDGISFTRSSTTAAAAGDE